MGIGGDFLVFGDSCVHDGGRVLGVWLGLYGEDTQFNDGKQIWETTTNVLLELCCFFLGKT